MLIQLELNCNVARNEVEKQCGWNTETEECATRESSDKAERGSHLHC